MDTMNLVRLGTMYGAHLGLTIKTVSTYAANDGKWLSGLDDGLGCTIRKANAVLCWFSNNWPVDLEWPRELARPAKSKREAA